MKGKDLIKQIKLQGLEEHNFCTTDGNCVFIKRSATQIIEWEDVEGSGCKALGKRYFGYDTGRIGKHKVAILE